MFSQKGDPFSGTCQMDEPLADCGVERASLLSTPSGTNSWNARRLSRTRPFDHPTTAVRCPRVQSSDSRYVTQPRADGFFSARRGSNRSRKDSMTTQPQITVEDLWIELPTGVRLSARRWYRADLTAAAPTIFEHLPYRLTDLRANRDNSWYQPLAAAGYVGLRVDIRGTGNSEGLFTDEYSAEELDDAEALVAWIRNQPWSDGTVGMIGISYSGFNALQLGTRNPPGLKAVIAAGFADDRFEQDVHRIGGAVHDQGLAWAQMCTGVVTLPPDPRFVDEDAWLQRWEQRLDAFEPPILKWLGHQRKDEYWTHGSARYGYDSMTCAVYAVSGWNDRYRDGVLSLMEHYDGPKKGLIGPWEHAWPQEAGIGPRLEFVSEAIRWFDHWLRGEDNGIMDEPSFHVWVEESSAPSTSFRHQDGKWVGLKSWPDDAVGSLDFSGSSTGLHSGSVLLDTDCAISSDSLIGLDGGVSAPFKSAATDLPRDQRADDGRSTAFDSPVLTEAIDILGQITVGLTVASKTTVATLSARLCDVFPDGTSRLISVGMMNLTMRDGQEQPTPLPRDRDVPVDIIFQGIGYTVPAGHRLRLSLSSNYWPWMWPSPETPHLTMVKGSRLSLSVPRLLTGSTRPVSDFYTSTPAHETVSGSWAANADPDENSTTIVHDLGSGRLERRSTSKIVTHPFMSDGAELTFRTTQEDRITDGEPLSAVSIMTVEETLQRRFWSTSVTTRTEISCDRENFIVDTTLTAKNDQTIVRDMTWHEVIPRDHG